MKKEMDYPCGFMAVFLAFSLLNGCFGSVDLTYFHLQHVADRLSLHDCDRLLASLKIQSSEYPGDAAIDTKARLIKNEATCIANLLRWNTEEGKEVTFSLLTRRLRQLGHEDLAKLLSREAFGNPSSSLSASDAETPEEAALEKESNIEPLDTASEDHRMNILVALFVTVIVIMIILSVISEAIGCISRFLKRDEILKETEAVNHEEEFKSERDRKRDEVLRMEEGGNYEEEFKCGRERRLSALNLILSS